MLAGRFLPPVIEYQIQAFSMGAMSDMCTTYSPYVPSTTPRTESTASSAMVPIIPLEIAEQIIDHLQQHRASILNCSLVCSGWSIRSRFHLFREVIIGSRAEVSSFLRLLTLQPHLKRLVSSVDLFVGNREIHPETFFEAALVQLLPVLPNIQRWTCRTRSYDDPCHAPCQPRR